MGAVMNEALLEDCANRSNKEIAELSAQVMEELGTDAEALLENTTVFVTGSVARGDMSEHSDVDMFVVRNADAEAPAKLDGAIITASIARALAKRQRPKPSRDGQFLQMQLLRQLVGELGKDTDDFHNHFTARMLLLLESKPLLSPTVYDHVVEAVIQRYWADAKWHPNDYVPYLLINDLVRYWRILLLNYAARTSDSMDPGDRRLQSYKLRFSRCLTCFSGLAFLMAEYRKSKNLLPGTAREMTTLTPLQRLAHVAQLEPTQAAVISTIRQLYAEFLSHTGGAKSEVVTRFNGEGYKRERASEGRAFGDAIFALVLALGEGDGREMLRFIVV